MTNLSRAKDYTSLSLIFLALLALSYPVRAENSHLLIVEVQIAGENASGDFIKIYNPSNSDIFLGNYQGSYLRLVKRTKSSTKDYSIKSWSKDADAKIPAKGYFLWASSKNESFPDSIRADVKTSQTLSQNNGVALRLGPENTGEIIDAVGWGDFNNSLFENTAFPQNPEPNQILSRKQIAGIYQDTNNNTEDFSLSTNKIALSGPAEDSLSTPSPSAPIQDSPSEAKLTINPEKKQYPKGIILSEVLPAPEGPDDTEEWIEIFNKNSFGVDLSGWQIKDTAGKIKTYIFPENTTIEANGYLLLKRPESKITLNNDADGLELFRPDGTISDKTSYEKSPQNASYNLTDSGWQWSSVLTPGTANIISSQNEDSKKTDESANQASQNYQASASKPFETKNKVPLLILFVAVSIALISGAGILILKKRVTKGNF